MKKEKFVSNLIDDVINEPKEIFGKIELISRIETMIDDLEIIRSFVYCSTTTVESVGSDGIDVSKIVLTMEQSQQLIDKLHTDLTKFMYDFEVFGNGK